MAYTILQMAGRVRNFGGCSVPSFCGGISSSSSASTSMVEFCRDIRKHGTASIVALQSSQDGGSLPVCRRSFVSGTSALLAFTTMATSVNQTSSAGAADATIVDESSSALAEPSTSSATTKTVFVAGSTGNTGKRIVKELLARGFRVRAGVRDLVKAEQVLPSGDLINYVLADVTKGADKLAEAITGVDAVVVATGFRPSITDPFASWAVDNLGTVAIVDAARKAGVKRLVLVSSILVNGAAVGQGFNPNYIFLNLLGLVLIAKLQAENYIKRSGINYTIIRPGGLLNTPPSGNIILAPEDTLFEGTISRDSVAQVAVDSLLFPEASYKTVEIIAKPDAPAKAVQELLASIPQ